MSRILLLFALIVGCNDSALRTADADNSEAGNDAGSDDGVKLGAESVEIDLDDYRGPCSTDSDCAVVADVFVCGCGHACAEGTVLAARAEDARLDLASTAEACTIELEGECDMCVDVQSPTPACVNQECITIPAGSCRLTGCDAFAAGRDIEWAFTPRCEDDICTECPCPMGSACDRDGFVCRALDACDEPRECDGGEGIRGYLGCVDGYCQNCRVDTDCRDDFFCNNGSCDLR